MRVSRQLYIAWGPDVPDSIRTQMLLNSLNVEFEQSYLPLTKKTESNYDDLYIWCLHNCTNLFTCNKVAHGQAVFMFYEGHDMTKFQDHIQKTS